MDKQSRKVPVLLKCLVALVLVTGISTTSVAAVIYNVDRAVGPGTITGTIETNGATGVLTAADIIDWNLTVDADGIPATLGQLLGPISGNNSSITFLEGSPLTATLTALFFDFSLPGFAIFQITTPGADVVWQLQAGIFSDELIREPPLPPANQAFVTHPPIQQQVATAAAVPEPTADVIYDNGSFSGGQTNFANTAGGQELFEDFVLTEASVITRIDWQQHDHNTATYNFTRLTIFDGLPFSAAPVFSMDLVGTSTANATGTLFGAWEGFDYSIDGLSIALGAGTYWLGLNSDFTGIRSGWDNTTGTADTIPGFRLVNNSNPPPGTIFDQNLAFQVLGSVSVQPVAIDIKPGSDPNAINPRSKGVIPVAVLTTGTFDAQSVDPSTVQFGPSGAGIGHRSVHFEDVDDDGDLDLLLHFRTQQTGVACGDTEASLTGQTFDGTPIEGSDSIVTVGCKSKGDKKGKNKSK